MALAAALFVPQPLTLGQGTVTGNAWVEQVKGRPGAYVPLYEWNIYTVIDGGAHWGHQFRVGLPPQPNQAYYTFPTPGNPTPLPGGTYSMFLDQPLFWGRPAVITHVPFPSSGTLNLNVELPTDYSCAFGGNYGIWGSNPWEWDSTWYQTFQATGTSVTGISIKMAGATASNVLMSIHQDNGGNVTTWPQVGPTRSRAADSNTDVWVRFRSDEIPTTPGQRYALKLAGQGGSLGMYRRIEDGQGYALGQAFSSAGQPRNYDLYAMIFSDNDGTVVPYVSRLHDPGALTHWEWAWSQEIRAKGTGLAGAVIYFAAATWDVPLSFRVRSGSATGPQVGPAKVGRGASQASGSGFAAASWNPGELPLAAGQLYYLEVSGVTDTSSNGLNPYRFTQAENMYSDGDAFANGIRQPGVDLHMQVVEYASVTPPTIDRSPASFTPTAARRTTPPNDTFTVANSGGGLLSYTIEESIPWLSVSPASGNTAGPPNTHTIQYDTANLSIGSYSGIITIHAPQATNTPQTISVNLTVTPPPFAPADFDQDGDVDQEDFAHFQRCLSGSGNPPPPGCQNADLDGDDDVDQADFNLFFECVSGPGVPADTTCAD